MPGEGLQHPQATNGAPLEAQNENPYEEAELEVERQSPSQTNIVVTSSRQEIDKVDEDAHSAVEERKSQQNEQQALILI